MGSSNADIIIQVDAETAKAIKNIEKFASDAVKKVKEMSDSFFELGHLAAAAFAGFTFKEIIAESVEADKAIRRLEGALAITGDATKDNVEGFKDYAEIIQEITGLDDEFILGQVSFLKTLGATDDQAKEVIKTATDLSVALGQDLGTSVQQLALLFEGSVPKSLAKLVPELKTLSEEQLRAGAGVDLLAKKFPNLAEAMSGSLSVQLSLVAERFKNVLQAIGDLITKSPAFLSILGFISDRLVTLKLSIENISFREFVADLLGLAAKAAIFIAVFKPKILMPFFDDLKRSLSTALEEFSLATLKLVLGFNKIEFGALAARVGINLLKAAATFGISLLIDELVSVGVQATSLGNFFRILGLDIQKLFIGFGQVVTGMLELIFIGLSRLPKVGDSFKGALNDIQNAQAGLSKNQDTINKQIEGMTKAGVAAAKAQKALGDETKKTTDHAAGLGQTSVEAFDKAKQKAQELAKALKFGDVTGLEKIKAEQAEKLKILEESQRRGIKLEEDYQTLRAKLDAETTRKMADERKKVLSSAGIQGGIGQALFTKVGGFENNRNPERLSGTEDVVKDLVTGIGKGAEGAKGLVGEAMTGIVSGLTGIPPQIAGPIIDLLGKSKDEVKNTVTSFVQQIPVIVTNIIENIPVIIQALIEAVPQFVEALILAVPDIITSIIESIPTIIEALVNAIPAVIQKIIDDIPIVIQKLAESIPQVAAALAAQAPFIAIRIATELAGKAPMIAIAFIEALVKEAPRFVTELVKSIPKAVGGAAGGVVGGIGGAVKSVGKFLGFAEGGLVPPGAPNDNFVARLTSGEFIVNNGLTPKLEEFLNRQSSSQSVPPQSQEPVVIQRAPLIVQFGPEEFARMMLTVTRDGFRIA